MGEPTVSQWHATDAVIDCEAEDAAEATGFHAALPGCRSSLYFDRYEPNVLS